MPSASDATLDDLAAAHTCVEATRLPCENSTQADRHARGLLELVLVAPRLEVAAADGREVRREHLRAELGGLRQQGRVWGGVDGDSFIIAGLVRWHGLLGSSSRPRRRQQKGHG